jgi:hypothetical protein
MLIGPPKTFLNDKSHRPVTEPSEACKEEAFFMHLIVCVVLCESGLNDIREEFGSKEKKKINFIHEN